MTNLLIKVRDILADNYQFNSETQDYITSKIFTLQYANVDSTSLKIYKNGVLWAGTNYSYSAGIVTVTGTLVAGDTLRFDYNAYSKYSDNELQGYIRAALYYLTAEQYGTFIIRPPTLIFPTPTEAEEALIAIVASILIKGSIRQYRTPEFTITFGENLSTEQKIKQLVTQFQKTFGSISYTDLSKEIIPSPNLEDDDED